MSSRFLHVGFDVVGDAEDECVRQAFFHRPFAPGEIGFLPFLAVAAMTLGQRQQAVGRVRAAVEHHVFAGLAQLGINVVINGDLPGIDDAQVHSGRDGVIEKYRVHRLAQPLIAAERERQVRYTARDVGMREALPDRACRFDEGDAVAVVLLHAGGDGEDVRVDDDVLRREADAVDEDVVGACGDRRLAFKGVGLAGLVEGHDHDRRAVAAHEPGMMDEGVLALLERDRIHHRLALHAFEAGLDHGEFRGVDHQRHPGDVGLRSDQVEEGGHRLLGIEQALVHVHVDDLGAVLDLVAGDGERGRIIAGGDELAETRRAGDVGALADIHERDLRRQRERFEPGEPQPRRDVRHLTRRLAGDRRGDGADVVGRGAAAAADDVDQTGVGKFADQARHGLRPLVIMAEFVGQAGVGIDADQRVGDARQLGNVRAHLSRAERAIEPDREWGRVGDRIPECLRRLPGKKPAGAVGDGAGNHHRHVDAALLQRLGHGEDRGLGVERVENRLDEQHVGAAIEQPAHLLGIGGAQLVEGDGAKARVQDVGRDRGGAVGRADGAGDETRAAVLVLRHARGLAREPRAFEVQFIGDLRHAVVGLGDAGRGESVGRNDVGAGAVIGEMNRAHRVGPREIEEIVVAAHLAVPGIEASAAITLLVEPERLDHRPHGAVEDENALGCELPQRGSSCRLDR